MSLYMYRTDQEGIEYGNKEDRKYTRNKAASNRTGHILFNLNHNLWSGITY